MLRFLPKIICLCYVLFFNFITPFAGPEARINLAGVLINERISTSSCRVKVVRRSYFFLKLTNSCDRILKLN